MIDFTRSNMTHFIIHVVGNKGLGEELTLSDKLIEFKDDFVKETLLRYLLSPFKSQIYHEFRKSIDITINSLQDDTADLFKSRVDFIVKSQNVAKHLYNQSMHPKIKGGELYVCFFKDVVVDGELCDGVGYFKTENKETQLEVIQLGTKDFDLDCKAGININKLDKGCIVFNTDSKSGFKLSIVDNNNKVAECALYWEEDFLNAKLKANAYYHTKNFIDMSRGFCEEILTEANNVSKEDQMMMLNNSVSFFKDKDNFNVAEFEKEVLKESDVISAFKDYRNDFSRRMDLVQTDEFEVSAEAVKKNKKYMRSVVKLDKNFHLYIHARHELLEKGFDEEKGMKYYKVYYVNEEN
jgi:hypothetical protein